jgi:hypothetical protein
MVLVIFRVPCGTVTKCDRQGGLVKVEGFFWGPRGFARKRAATPLVENCESKRGRKKVPQAPDRDLRLDEADACRNVTEHSQGAKISDQDRKEKTENAERK